MSEENHQVAGDERGGSLAAIRVLELGGIGPAPFAAMLLADMGADVIRIDRPGGRASLTVSTAGNAMLRNRRSVLLDLKQPPSVDAVLRMVEQTDILIEGFRPGVMERLGLGPTDCLAKNPDLVYGRITGWGQDGPLAQAAGHDINYIARAGVLAGMGENGSPPPVPLNLIGDFGGGGFPFAFGILCALHVARNGGGGQVVDSAMVDGVALLATSLHSLVAEGGWLAERGTNLMDGGAPFYTVYETADARYLAVGAVEPQFYAAFLHGLGLPAELLDTQYDRATWPSLKQTIGNRIRQQVLEHWLGSFDGIDACVSPVLTLEEASQDAHARARDAYHRLGGITVPAATPRLSRTPARIHRPPPARLGADTAEVLSEFGLDVAEIFAGGGADSQITI